MADWPDCVPVLFVDGPLAGEVHEAPAQAGLPAMMLRVRLGESAIEVRSARDQAPAAGWVSYLGLGRSRVRPILATSAAPPTPQTPITRPAPPTPEPWPFVYAD